MYRIGSVMAARYTDPFPTLRARSTQQKKWLAFRGSIAHTHRDTTRVSLRWEPVRFDRLPVKSVRSGSGLGRYQTGPNSKFKFEFKKMKKSQKNPKNISRCGESNGVKFSQKFVHLV